MSALQQELGHYEFDMDTDVQSRQGLLANEKVTTRVTNHASRSKCSRWLVILTFFNVALLGVTIVLLLTAGPCIVRWTKPMNVALFETSIHSPILDNVDINMVRTHMNGSVWRSLDTSWNGDPDDPVKEAAWDDFDDIRIIPITSDDIVKMGQDPSISATLDDAHWHLGEDRYIGGLDIFHQIHCLNYVRKAALKGATAGSRMNGSARLHTIHCIDMLMQHLLCTGDTGIITYNWYEGMKPAQPNFSVNRKCVDWRQLVEYRDAHAVPQELWSSYEKPAGARVLQKGDV